MSSAIWDATNQKEIPISGLANINDSVVSEDSTWSSEKLSASLGEIEGKIDKKIFDSATNFFGVSANAHVTMSDLISKAKEKGLISTNGLFDSTITFAPWYTYNVILEANVWTNLVGCTIRFVGSNTEEVEDTYKIIITTPTTEVIYDVINDTWQEPATMDKVNANLGKLSELKTTEKTNLVNAINEVANKSKIAKVVAQDGSGDFETITEAIESYELGDSISLYIKSGDYHESLNLRNKYKSVVIVGEHRDTVRIINDVGNYGKCPIVVAGNFKISNLTLLTLANFNPTYNESDMSGTYPSYALHIDDPNYDDNAQSYGFVENCMLLSFAFPAVGMGVNNRQSIEFRNNKIIRDTTDSRFKKEGWQGAFYAHCSNMPNSVSKNLILFDNYIECNYGVSAHFKFTLQTPQNTSLQAVNNIFISKEKGTNDILYEKSTSILQPCSTRNTADALNAMDSNAIQVTSHGVDLNSYFMNDTLPKKGYCYNALNAPRENEWFLIETYPYQDLNFSTQKATSLQNGDTFTRVKWDGSWKSWSQK